MEEIKKLLSAWNDRGPRPEVHEQVKHELKTHWPTLYKAINELDVNLRIGHYDYKVLIETSTYQLERKVSELLVLGYVPNGSMVIRENPYYEQEPKFIQAMLRK